MQNLEYLLSGPLRKKRFFDSGKIALKNALGAPVKTDRMASSSRCLNYVGLGQSLGSYTSGNFPMVIRHTTLEGPLL